MSLKNKIMYVKKKLINLINKNIINDHILFLTKMITFLKSESLFDKKYY